MSHSNNRIIHKYISIMVQSNKRQPYLPPNVKVVAFSVEEGYNISATTFEPLLGGNSYGGSAFDPVAGNTAGNEGLFGGNGYGGSYFDPGTGSGSEDLSGGNSYTF